MFDRVRITCLVSTIKYFSHQPKLRLTHYSLVLLFYTPCKHQKTLTFFCFCGLNWKQMGQEIGSEEVNHIPIQWVNTCLKSTVKALEKHPSAFLYYLYKRYFSKSSYVYKLNIYLFKVVTVTLEKVLECGKLM